MVHRSCLEGISWSLDLVKFPILPWLVRHQSFLRYRFVVRFEELTMSKFQSPLLNFGEAVLEAKRANWVRRGIMAFGWDDRRGQMNIL